MVPLFRYSSTNLCTSIISSCVRGSSHPGSDLGVLGKSSIVWSHIVCRGNLCDFHSSNTFLCHLYSSRRSVLVCFGFLRWIVMLLMKYRLHWIDQGIFFDWGVKIARFALLARKIIGSWVWSIHPYFQSIFGWFATNHGYPNMAFYSPIWVRKKHSFVILLPVCTCKSVWCFSSPLTFSVLFMLNSFLGWASFLMRSFSHLAYNRFMKFSVAPESKRAVASALFATECMKKQTVIDLHADINTSPLLLCLINAKVIRWQENPDLLCLSWLFLGQSFPPWTYC